MPKLKTGAVVYGLVAIGEVVSAVLILRHFGPYAEVHGWSLTGTAIVVALTGVVSGVGAATRRGLAADDGPWICRRGWLVLVALTAAAFAIDLLSQQGLPVLPMGPVVFLPHWIRRMHEQYYLGVADAEREIAAVRAAERDGQLLPPS